MHQKCEKMSKNGPKMTKMMQLMVINVILVWDDVVECEKSNFNYWQKSKMCIESEYLSNTTGTCI